MRLAASASVLFAAAACAPEGQSVPWPADLPEVSFLVSIDSESGLIHRSNGPFLDASAATLGVSERDQLLAVGWDKDDLMAVDEHIDLARLADARFQTGNACAAGEVSGVGTERSVALPLAPTATALRRIDDRWEPAEPPEGSVSFARSVEGCGLNDRQLPRFVPTPLNEVGITIEGEDPDSLYDSAFDVYQLVPITERVVIAKLEFGLARVERDANWTNDPDDLLTARQLLGAPRKITIQSLRLLSRTSTSVEVIATIQGYEGRVPIDGFIVRVRWAATGPAVVVDRRALPGPPGSSAAVNAAGEVLLEPQRGEVPELWVLRAWSEPIERTGLSGGGIEFIQSAPSLGPRAFWASDGSAVYSVDLEGPQLEVRATSIRSDSGRVFRALHDDAERLRVGTDAGHVLEFDPDRAETRELEIWLGPDAECPGNLQNRMICSRPLISRVVRRLQTHDDRLLIAVDNCPFVVEHALGRRCDAGGLETRAGITDPLSLARIGEVTVVGAEEGDIFVVD